MFNDKMNMITQLKLDDEDNKIVSVIRRSTKSNVLAAGTNSNVYLIKFDKGTKFKTLCIVKNLHSGVDPISSLVFFEYELYSCSQGDDYVKKITFVE